VLCPSELTAGDRVQRQFKALKFLSIPQCLEWLQKPSSPSDEDDLELGALREVAKILGRPSKKQRVQAAFNAEAGEVWDDADASDGTVSA
jgi:hypothetical protein